MCCASDRRSTTRRVSRIGCSPHAPKRGGASRRRRSRPWTRRCGSGAAPRSRSSRTTTLPGPRPPGSRSCASPRSRTAPMPSSRSDATSSSSASSNGPSACTRCGSARVRSSCLRSTAPGVRSRRSGPTRTIGATSSTSSASSRRLPCAPWKGPWSSKRRSSTTSRLHSPRGYRLRARRADRFRRHRFRSRSATPRRRARSRTGSRAPPRPGSTSTCWRTSSPTTC